MNEPRNCLSIEISPTDGHCPAGEKAGAAYMREAKIPVLSCEGACLRGEIARQAANLLAKEEPYRRGCHGELLTVPDSALAQWMMASERIVLIDGCFLHCHGRILENTIDHGRLAKFDAHSIYRKYSDAFDIDEVPEVERAAAARLVADAVLAELSALKRTAAAGATSSDRDAAPSFTNAQCGGCT